MEQQLAQSDTKKLPPPQQWWSYRASENDPTKLDKKTQAEFAVWRQALHDQDLAIGIGHKFFNSKEDARKAFCGPDVDENCFRVLCEVPFACVLEALGLLPKRWNGDGYVAYGQKYQFVSSLRLERCDGSDDVKIVPGTLNGSNKNTSLLSCFFKLSADDIKKQITIGNLLHHNMMNNIEKEQARLSGYYVYGEHRETWKFWCGIFDVTDEEKRISCGELFHTTLYDWESKKETFERHFGKDNVAFVGGVVTKFYEENRVLFC